LCRDQTVQGADRAESSSGREQVVQRADRVEIRNIRNSREHIVQRADRAEGMTSMTEGN